jgi:signal transduction histidine kinase/CheY-like chemotaxis protein
MSGEPAHIDTPHARPSPPELLRALDVIRDRLTRLEHAAGSPGLWNDAALVDPGDDAASAVALVDDILAMPSMSLDPGELFSLAMGRATRLLGVDRAMLLLPRPDGGLVPRSAQGFRREDLESIAVQPGEGIVGAAFKDGRLLTYPSTEGDEVRDAFIERFPVEVAIAVPLRAEGEVAGVLYAGRRRPAPPFGPSEILLLLVIADRVAGGLMHQTLLGRGLAAHVRAIDVEKARAVSQLAGGLARDLTGIFAVILGKTRLLLPRIQDEPLREGLGVLEEAAWRGADVVDRLTALAGPVAGETAQLVDVTALLLDVLAAARPNDTGPEASAPRIEIVTDLRAVPPVRGSAAALRDAFVNIARNSIDAMPRGGRLTLATRALDAGAEIALEDTGEGIPDDARRRVFDPFYTTRATARMGLGLTVVHGVITRHGGRIEISSPLGGGTRVVIWLPAEPAMSSLSPPSVAPRVPERIDTRPEMASILVIEDEEAVRSLLITALTTAGYAVETTEDGPSGIAKLESRRFDVVLADLTLPQCSGLAVAQSAKQMHPRMPVVLIAGWAHMLDPERLRERGVDLMLVKPFRLERVLSVVSDALRLGASA